MFSTNNIHIDDSVKNETIIKSKPLSYLAISACTCPISLEIMVDPVITKQGYTFEHASILKWLECNDTCPLSRTHLTVKELIPNKCLKKSIERFRKNGKLPKLKEPVHENTVHVVPTVTCETRPMTGTYYYGPLDPVDIPVNPNFSFLCDSDHSMIQSAYNTISRLEKWDYMRRYSPSDETGYMMDHDPIIGEIITSINDEYHYHSGASLGYTMRRMQYVANYGYDDFTSKYL